MLLRFNAKPVIINAIAFTVTNAWLFSTAAVSATRLWHPQQLATRTATPSNHGRKLRVHNTCSQPIELVLRHKDPQQTWQTQGWWTIPSKTSRDFSDDVETLQLSSRVMFYYARAPQAKLLWSGNGSHTYPFEQQTLDMRIHYAEVDVLDDYSLFILCNDAE